MVVCSWEGGGKWRMTAKVYNLSGLKKHSKIVVMAAQLNEYTKNQ